MHAVEQQLQRLAQRPIGAEHADAFRIAVELDLYGLRLFFRFDPRVRLRRHVGLFRLASQRPISAEHTAAFRIAVDLDRYAVRLLFRLRRRVGLFPVAAQRQAGAEQTDA